MLAPTPTSYKYKIAVANEALKGTKWPTHMIKSPLAVVYYVHPN